MKEYLSRVGLCFGVFGFCLYSYLDEHNSLRKLKMELPQKQKEIQAIREEMSRLSYQIDKFENPTNLIEIVHRPEYGHLRHPILKDILTVPEAFASNEP